MSDETPRDEGFSAVEVIITTMLLAIVLALLAGVMISVTSSTSRASRLQRTTQDVNLTLRSVGQEVRSAMNIAPCGVGSPGYGGCLQFDVPRTAGDQVKCPQYRMTYSLKTNPGRLVASRVNYVSGTASDCNAIANLSTAYTEKLVLGDLTTNGQDLFIYFGNDDGSPFNSTTDAASISGATQVRLTVVANTGIKDAKAVRLSTLAALRNNRTESL